MFRYLRFRGGLLTRFVGEKALRFLERAIIPALLVGSLALLGTVLWKSRAWLNVAATISADQDARDRIQAENEIMRTLAQVLGGAFVLAGLYFTGRSIFAERRGQMSDRFAKAMEDLADENELRRIGSLHSLEGLSRESSADYPRVIAYVAQFVREETRGPEYPSEGPPRGDVQQALDLLARRRRAFRVGEKRQLDLRGAQLRGADLREANLEGVRFDGADLRGAILHRAFLRNASFANARLDRANMNQADLRDVNFWKAKLDKAQLRRARLDRASFASASLQNVSMDGTRLSGVLFQSADLGQASLRGARLRRCVFADCSLARTDLSDATFAEIVALTQEQLSSASGVEGLVSGSSLQPERPPDVGSDR